MKEGTEILVQIFDLLQGTRDDNRDEKFVSIQSYMTTDSCVV